MSRSSRGPSEDAPNEDTAVKGYLRIVWVGLLLRVREFSTSRFFILMALIQPVIFAAIAFYLFQAGGRSGTLPYAALGAGNDGDLVVDALRLWRSAPVEPVAGHARVALGSPPRSSSCCCR